MHKFICPIFVVQPILPEVKVEAEAEILFFVADARRLECCHLMFGTFDDTIWEHMKAIFFSLFLVSFFFLLISTAASIVGICSLASSNCMQSSCHQQKP
jgi:hypothetical protein